MSEDELLRLRDSLHDLRGDVGEMQLKVGLALELSNDVKSLHANVKSLTESISSNAMSVMQRLVTTERWQESHEQLDDERWRNLGDKLSEIKGMLESIPIKLGEDLDKLETRTNALSERIDEHDELLAQAKGAALAWRLFFGVISSAVLVMTLLRFFGGPK